MHGHVVKYYSIDYSTRQSVRRGRRSVDRYNYTIELSVKQRNGKCGVSEHETVPDCSRVPTIDQPVFV